MLGGGNEPFLAPESAWGVGTGAEVEQSTHGATDNVGDPHEVVVNHVGKVVGREAVAFHEDEVVLGLAFSITAIDEVVELDWARAASKPDGVRSAVSCLIGRLLSGKAQTRARIQPSRSAGGIAGDTSERRQVMRGAETSKGPASLQ